VSRHVRVYRRLVRLFPTRFREEYGDEMVRLFADQLRDARASGTSRAVVGLWARSAMDLLMTAPGQHLREERPVPQTVQPGFVDAGLGGRPPSRVATALAAAPLLIWAVLSLTAPGFTEPLYANPPAIVGLPAGLCLIAMVAVLTLGGLVLVRRARSRAGVVVALACFTVPAGFLLVLAPSLVLSMLNAQV
jgi:hypothetical protein